MRRAWISAVMAALLGLGCSNAGESRLLSVSGQGVFRGAIYFDLDGNRVLSAADDSVKNMKVRLVSLSGQDTVATATSLVTGVFRVSGVPVGTYRVLLDTTPLVDTAKIAQQDSLQVTILPGDSATVILGVGYPHVSIRAARTTVPAGRRVFVEGIVLNAPFNFRDTTMHVQDTSGAIRAARIVASPVVAADSVRLRATTGTRNPGSERILDVVTVFVVKPAFLPTASTITTGQAAAAKLPAGPNGALHAQQIQVLNAPVTGVDSTSGPDYIMTVNDGSGSLDVVLDPQADPAFKFPSRPVGLYNVPNKFDIVGLLVPSGTPGVWRLKPRSSAELVKR